MEGSNGLVERVRQIERRQDRDEDARSHIYDRMAALDKAEALTAQQLIAIGAAVSRVEKRCEDIEQGIENERKAAKAEYNERRRLSAGWRIMLAAAGLALLTSMIASIVQVATH
jgi:septal ring factor EnvC (AmiA/AmiB activator)